MGVVLAASTVPGAPAETGPAAAQGAAAAPTTTAGPTSPGAATASGPSSSTAATLPSTAAGTPPAAGAPAASAPASASGPAALPPAADAPSHSIVYHTAERGRTVALTFDDGPGPATAQVLDLLAQYHAKATFCQIGPQAAADPAIVKRIVADGHRLCDHTVNHPQPMHTLPHDRQVFEIDGAKDMITKAGGPGTKVGWFRAPGGDFSADNRAIAVQSGLRPLGWTVDTRDWCRPGAAAILATAQQELHPGGIILMHDGGGDRSQTVAALSQLLPWLVQQGYTFDFPAS
ncbi:polysaccharide deacetylase family protein [Kitasatospora sp. NPDC056138]|uniref:polysaccharide deacetylase family protein n=1 Tax=Kitasatospora sp. NPDC056138 TaxID=3345724 RepID=UPI0035DBE05D